MSRSTAIRWIGTGMVRNTGHTYEKKDGTHASFSVSLGREGCALKRVLVMERVKERERQEEWHSGKMRVEPG